MQPRPFSPVPATDADGPAFLEARAEIDRQLARIDKVFADHPDSIHYGKVGSMKDFADDLALAADAWERWK